MKNLFKSSLIAVLMATAGMFTSCSSDSTGGGGSEGEPKITFSPTTGVVQLCGGTVNVEVKTENKWDLSISANGSDITPSRTSGNGSTYVSFDVPEVTAKRTVVVSFTAYGKIAGIDVKKKFPFTIEQSNGGHAIYYEDCGTEVSKETSGWPYVDKFTGWTRKGAEGFDQKGVLYAGKNATVRNSGPEWDPLPDTDPSGAPYAYINKSDAMFEIQKIVIDQTEKNYTIGFTAFDTYASLSISPYTPAYVKPTNDNLKLQVSVDGAKWGTVKFEAIPTTLEDNGWFIASAPFTLPQFAKELYIRFSNFVADTTTALPSSDYAYQASMRIDDIELSTGGQGPVVVWEEDPTPTAKTVAQVKAAGAGQYIVTGTVVATASTGFILGDATGAIYAYKKSHGLKIGDKVQISGSYEKYSGSKCWEFNSPTVTSVATADSYTYAPVEKDGAGLDALFAEDAQAQECQFTGVAEVGSYVNFTISGTTVKCGLAGVTASDYSQYDGQTVTVKGFLVGNTTTGGSSICNFMQYEIIADPTAPQLTLNPTSLNFESTGETKTITATTNGLTGFELNATSDNNAFTVTINGNTISVATTSTTTAQQGTLTVTYSNGTKTATRTATLKQKAPTSGDDKTLTVAYADIVSGKTGSVDLDSNGYGSMDVTNSETWYTWKTTANFTGCKICKGNGSSTKDQYKYNVIQIQGNSSDAAKQGFMMNTSSLVKIKNIKITVKNSKASNKPAYKIYFGTEQNPSTNEQVAKGATSEEKDSAYYFTDEFAPTGTTSYGYFKILNNSGYAVYLESIEITYTDK